MLDITIPQSIRATFETVEVKRQDPNDTRRILDVASGVSMSIQPQSTFEDPSQFQRETPRPRFKAYVVPKNTAIRQHDIIISLNYGELSVAGVLNYANTNVMELELEKNG